LERKIDLNTICLWGDDIHFQMHLDGHTAHIAISRRFLMTIRPDPRDPYLTPERLLAKLYEVAPAIDAAALAEGPSVRRVIGHPPIQRA
jgi:hypothetical protein